MKIARVILNWDCNRNCDHCCNKALTAQPESCWVSDLADYDEVLITGGEPMLHPEDVADLVESLRMQAEELGKPQKIYLYTALFSPWLFDLAAMVDGIHFTLHHPLTQTDWDGFNRFQRVIGKHQDSGKSFRLYIDSRVRVPISILPKFWSRVEIKAWQQDCPLPPNEVLLQMGDA